LASGLHGERLAVVGLDVTDEVTMVAEHERVAAVSAGRLDLLINNAGCFAPGEEGLAHVGMESMLHVFAVNAVGPVVLARILSDLLRAAAPSAVVNLVSGSGLLTENEEQPGGQYSYGASKAALNVCVRKMAADLREGGVTVVGLGPGFVLTDMTKGAPVPPNLHPEESVRGMIRVIESLTLEQTGRFYGYDGRASRWFLPR
jgi:NAD(P)-dependent dehydrogenase (short-subunit alcohol dehydrogenase family)